MSPAYGDTVHWYRNRRMRLGKVLRIEGKIAVIRCFHKAGGEERVAVTDLRMAERPRVPVGPAKPNAPLGIDLPAPYALSLDALDVVSKGGSMPECNLRQSLAKLGYITETAPGRYQLTPKGQEILQ